MKKRILLTALWGLLSPTDLFASGDGVLKQPGGPAYLLDFVEQGIEDQAIYNDAIATDADIKARVAVLFRGFSDPPTELIAKKLSEISAVDGILGRFLLDAMELLQWRLVRSEIVNIPDSDAEIEFGNFQLIQLAVQRLQSVYVSREAWNLLPPDHRAGLIFHETVLAMLKPTENEQEANKNSVIAREIVSYFFTYALSDRGPEGLATMLNINPEHYIGSAREGQAGHLPFQGHPQQTLFGDSKNVVRYAFLTKGNCGARDLFLQSTAEAAKSICRNVREYGSFQVQAFAGTLKPYFSTFKRERGPGQIYIRWEPSLGDYCKAFPSSNAYLTNANFVLTENEDACIRDVEAVLKKWKGIE